LQNKMSLEEDIYNNKVIRIFAILIAIIGFLFLGNGWFLSMSLPYVALGITLAILGIIKLFWK